MLNFKLNCGLVIALCLVGSIACADSLELKNGSLIEGKFLGGTDSEISFQVASSVQKYKLADIVSLKFNSERTTDGMPSRPSRQQRVFLCELSMASIPLRTTWAIVSRLRLKNRLWPTVR